LSIHSLLAKLLNMNKLIVQYSSTITIKKRVFPAIFQVPFVIGGHSQSASGSSNQYCTVLNSYLHNLGSSVVNANLTTSAVNDGMTLQNAVNSSVSTHSGQSSSLIHMVSIIYINFILVLKLLILAWFEIGLTSVVRLHILFVPLISIASFVPVNKSSFVLCVLRLCDIPRLSVNVCCLIFYLLDDS